MQERAATPNGIAGAAVKLKYRSATTIRMTMMMMMITMIMIPTRYWRSRATGRTERVRPAAMTAKLGRRGYANFAYICPSGRLIPLSWFRKSGRPSLSRRGEPKMTS